MNQKVNIVDWDGKRENLLSILWIYLTVNYIYCDVFTLHHADYLEAFLAGRVGSMEITETFLLVYALIMQIPMIMIVLSHILSFKLNRNLNIVAGILTTANQVFTVSMGGTPHFMLFSFFEIGAGLAIIYLALTWKKTSR